MKIFLCSKKGGSGKSTLCCSLAGLLSLMGYEVLIIDTDPQTTSGNWVESRTEVDKAPIVSYDSAIGESALKQSLKKSEGKFDFILVDLQGVDSESNRRRLVHADKVIFPFKPSQPDLDNLKSTRVMENLLRELKPEVECYYLLNECPTTTTRERNEARTFFEYYQVPLMEPVIHSRKVYRDSMSVGLSVCEMGNSKAREEVEQVLSVIIGMDLEDIQSHISDNQPPLNHIESQLSE